MLKQRVITALILASLVIWGVLRLPDWGFALLLSVVVALAAWEWGALLGRGRSVALGYTVLILVLLGGLWWQREHTVLLYVLLGLSAVFWGLALLWLYRFNRAPTQQATTGLLSLIGLIVLAPPWLALLVLRESPRFGAEYVLFLLLLIWFADSGAYFAGRAWGKHKLAPHISPGKTLEGVLGALVVSLVVTLTGAMVFDLQPAQWPGFVLICLGIVLFSIAGDLFESMIKRQRRVKDSSHLLPGHGGVLDRVDSLTAAAPLFLLALLWLLE